MELRGRELTEDCSYRFSGRLLFRDDECSELDTDQAALQVAEHRSKEGETSHEKAEKRVPTMEELLLPSLAEKVRQLRRCSRERDAFIPALQVLRVDTSAQPFHLRVAPSRISPDSMVQSRNPPFEEHAPVTARRGVDSSL